MSNYWRKLPRIILGLLFVIVLLLPETLPWILLVLLCDVCWFTPKRGLIGPVLLPANDAFLPSEEVQWWYWTGHLQTKEGRRFGFEVVFFAFDNFLFMRDQLAQAAISDIDGNRFKCRSFLQFHRPNRRKNGFNLSSGRQNKITAIGGNGHDRLHSEVDNYVLDLELKASKPPVLQYGGNAHPYHFGGYTYYYSRPKMETTGTLTIAGETFEVSGNSWFDRQYGELYQAIQQGWQWFAIELEDNRQIMIFDFKGSDAEIEKSGSISDSEGKTITLAPHEFQVITIEQWISPDTGCSYPSGWEVEVRGEKFIVQPLLKDQELHGEANRVWIGPVYWEGACSVSGEVSGKAYVELNGYCGCAPEIAKHIRKSAQHKDMAK